MPSFDIVNKIDMQEVDNAVNITRKMIKTRYDFRNSRSEIILRRKEARINVLAEDSMKMKAIESELATNLARRKIDLKALDYGDTEAAAQDMIRKDIRIKEGIDIDTARRIVKMIKGTKLKVQAAIQDRQVRVTGKKIDDLQAVIAMLKEQEMGLPLQFINMRS
ncbi:MAG: YajQ family cyclic di-GMP-binding protein [Thermoleophilia bacterium]|nr:YajQ family cyclic di-GMP-binding protein [Thermoleophilia bacterium]